MNNIPFSSFHNDIIPHPELARNNIRVISLLCSNPMKFTNKF